MRTPIRSFIIPILDYSPHSKYNIRTLLEDLSRADGEVICIFNSQQVFDDLRGHPRINKFCFNSANAGVSRSWNMGLNLAEGRSAFILNADLHITPFAIERLDNFLRELPNAVMVGPEGANLHYKEGVVDQSKHFSHGAVSAPQRVDSISGFLMAINRERFETAGMKFDIQFSPCFSEEWDIGLQAHEKGLSCYVVPLKEYEHQWGVSGSSVDELYYFNRMVSRREILIGNRRRLNEKWGPILSSNTLPLVAGCGTA